MKRIPLPAALSLSLLVSHLCWAEPLKYPATHKIDQVDDYHGVKVADPYRWLEDADSTETAKWVKAQNEVTFGYLRKLPKREALRERLTALWNHPRYGVPFREGGNYFFSKNDGLQNQAVLYMQPSLDAEPRVLLDPNSLSKDGTVALSALDVSPDGKRLAYGLARAGSDWQEYRVRDVQSGDDTADVVQWSKFASPSWTKDGRGFFYSRFPEPVEGKALRGVNLNHKIYYHVVGEPQEKDKLVLETPDEPEWRMGAQVTEDGRYAVISISKTGPFDRIYYINLKDPAKPQVDGPVVKLIDAFEASYDVVGNDGSTFYVRTDLNAPRGRVIAIDLAHPERENWRELIPQHKTDMLQSLTMAGDRFVAAYLHNAYSRLELFDPAGKSVRDVELPGIGSVSGLRGKRDSTELFFGFTSYLHPPTIYRYDVSSGERKVLRQSEVAFDASPYVTEQVFYSSKDGTRVPMFLTHRKDLKRDGSNPVYLYGYGGFNISLTPGFSVSYAVWLEQGGMLAIPNLRGGGEFGEEWHKAGTQLHKQNVFDDFIAAAEYLIREKYTSPGKIAIAGGSNGGLLVGATLNQRPDLFGCALPAVGVMDMLRFHKFTIGSAWTYDYGSSDDAEQFKALYAYSPLHNVKPGTTYPPTLVTTADHDDRVVPGHSFKYAAALQAAQAGDAPTLIRIETKAGHGAGKPTAKIIEEEADRWAFVMHALGMDGAEK